MKRLSIMLLCMTTVAGGMIYFNRVVKPQVVAGIIAANTPPPPVVLVAEAKVVRRSVRLSGIGSLRANHQVTLAPEAGGRVVGIFFDSGDLLHAGVPLVQLNDALDRADLMNFQAQSEAAAREFARSTELARNQFAAVKTVDESRQQLRQAAAGIAKTEAAIAQKRVLVPFDGQIGIRQVEVGQFLSAGSPIAVLTDLNDLRVDFSLPEHDRSKVRIGQEVDFSVDAFPGRSFTARLTAIDPQISPETRTIRVQASVNNADHALLPGMFADVSVLLDGDAEVLAVPETAIDVSIAGEGAYVVSPDPGPDGTPVMHAHRVAVNTGDRFDGLVAVSNGLSAGALVVSAGQQRLIPGFPVVPQRDVSAAQRLHLAKE
jgi:multidrug efflux system membrane fusion protein